jgi:transposase
MMVDEINKRTKRHYDIEFKKDAVRLVKEEGRTIYQVAEELGIPHNTLGGWIKKYRVSVLEANSSNYKTDDKTKIRDLEKELRRVTMERDILKKAMVYFVDLPK